MWRISFNHQISIANRFLHMVSRTTSFKHNLGNVCWFCLSEVVGRCSETKSCIQHVSFSKNFRNNYVQFRSDLIQNGLFYIQFYTIFGFSRMVSDRHLRFHAFYFLWSLQNISRLKVKLLVKDAKGLCFKTLFVNSHVSSLHKCTLSGYAVLS